MVRDTSTRMRVACHLCGWRDDLGDPSYIEGRAKHNLKRCVFQDYLCFAKRCVFLIPA